MAAGFIDLFRKVWGWLAVDSGEAPAEPDGSICVAAGGAFVIGLACQGSAHTIGADAGGLFSIGQHLCGDAHLIGVTAGGSHAIGQNVKGSANCDCC